ncbi:MAG TPA: hypothetical protein V6D18_19585 [Thermosynechococcaceae cyanobacterium]
MSPIQFIGSASFGTIRTTAPLAILSADASLLTLKVGFTSYYFYSHQVIALECISRFTVHIVHTIKDYPDDILFSTSKNSQQLVGEIYQTGFVPSGQACKKMEARGSPVREWLVVLFLGWWPIQFWVTSKYPELSQFMPLPILTFAGILIICVSLLASRNVQMLILKSGRSVQEIKPVIYLIIFLSVGFLLIMLHMLVSGQYSTDRLCNLYPLKQNAWWCSKRTNWLR